jgi:hypothetical protein
MAFLLFKPDKLFILLVPAVIFPSEPGFVPSEPDFVQKFPSVWSHFVVLVEGPLLANPTPQRLVLLVAFWHHTVAIHSFKLDKLFILLVPAVIFPSVFVPSEPDFVQKFLSVWSHFVVLVVGPLLTNPQP